MSPELSEASGYADSSPSKAAGLCINTFFITLEPWSMSYFGWKCRCQALYSWSVSDSSEYVLFKGTPVTDVIATGQNMPCSALQLGCRNSAQHQSRANVNGFLSLCWQRQQQKLQLGRKQCKRLHAKIFHWRNHC